MLACICAPALTHSSGALCIQVLPPALPRLARAGAPGPTNQRHLRAHFVQGAAHPGRADGEALPGRGRGRDGHARRAQGAQNVQDHEAAAGQGGRPRAAPELATGCVITNTMTNVLNTTPNPAMTPMTNSSKAGIAWMAGRVRPVARCALASSGRWPTHTASGGPCRGFRLISC